MKIVAYEDFEILDEIQFFKNIKIEMGYPFCEITFDSKDFRDAIQIVSVKFLGGFNDKSEEGRKIYLNKSLLKNDDLFLWKKELLDIFIENNKNKLHAEEIKNKFTIKLGNKEQFDYIKNAVLVEVKE